MTDAKDTSPVIIGAGQITERDISPPEASSPIALMIKAVKLAADDAGMSAESLARADMVITVPMFNDMGIANPPGCVADAIGAAGAKCVLAGFGGTSPHSMLCYAANSIISGKADLAVLTGAEAQHTMLQARKAGISIDWKASTKREDPERFPPLTGVEGACETEHIHGISLPANVYPMFENSLRRIYGDDHATHQQKIGELMSSLTRVASQNPLAWFRDILTPEEIITVTPENRNTAFPYTKRMNAMLFVNQSAALVVTSQEQADRMGIARSKRVYLHGYAEAHDHWNVLSREEYGVSPAIRVVGQKALVDAGKTIEEIDFFDLYSCFPVSVQVTRDMLGIPADDPRPLSVTGGLPYFGGPGNNYVMHSMAQMVQLLRANPGKFGLVTGNSFYMTKHSTAVCSTEPLHGPLNIINSSECQQHVDSLPARQINPEPSGPAVVDTYTVVYNRENEPQTGIVIGTTRDGRRFAAYTPADRDLLVSMTQEEFYGVKGTVISKEKVNTFTPD